MITVAFAIAAHDALIARDGGLSGFAQGGSGALESALQRVENHILYEGLENVFEISALYAVAIARGHIFNDGNKRTGLACALTYLYDQGVDIAVAPCLEDAMVEVAQGSKDYRWFAQLLASLVA